MNNELASVALTVAEREGNLLTMTDAERPAPDESSSLHRRRPGIRYVFSVAAILGGFILAVRFGFGPVEDARASWVIWAGVALILLGLASIPVYRWMDMKRL